MKPLLLRAGRHTLAMHRLLDRDGPALLLLHQAEGSSRDWREDDLATWPGPVFGLDFCGHGESEWIAGGGYAPELFAADADQALATIGAAHVVGSGLGAYVALLLAGTRPEAVRGALLWRGRGLVGHGPEPNCIDLDARTDELLAAFEGPRDEAEQRAAPDPMVALSERDIRPLPYARSFAERASQLVLAALDGEPPEWWRAAAEVPSVREAPAAAGPVETASRIFSPSLSPTSRPG